MTHNPVEFKLPLEIQSPIPGISHQTILVLNILLNTHRLGQDLFEKRSLNYTDWIILFVIISNEDKGRSTVIQHLVEATGKSYGTVRTNLERFIVQDYIRLLQKIGRSELYVPTEKLKNRLNVWGEELAPYIKRITSQELGIEGTLEMKHTTDKEWQKSLTAEQYKITRKAETEHAYSSPYWNSKQKGTYHCVCCQQPLFSSDTKFESQTGWPSFFKPIDESSLTSRTDTSHTMSRTEILCRHCDAHLGHVFSDGPEPTGLRYCINGISLKLITVNDT